MLKLIPFLLLPFLGFAATPTVYCDTLIMKDGVVHIGQITTETKKAITFLPCNDSLAQPLTVSRKDIRELRYVEDAQELADQEDMGIKAITYGILGLVLNTLLFVLTLPLSITAIVRGEKLLRHLKEREKDKRAASKKARKLAKAAVLIGSITIFIQLILLYLFLFVFL